MAARYVSFSSLFVVTRHGGRIRNNPRISAPRVTVLGKRALRSRESSRSAPWRDPVAAVDSGVGVIAICLWPSAVVIRTHKVPKSSQSRCSGDAVNRSAVAAHTSISNDLKGTTQLSLTSASSFAVDGSVYLRSPRSQKCWSRFGCREGEIVEVANCVVGAVKLPLDRR